MRQSSPSLWHRAGWCNNEVFISVALEDLCRFVISASVVILTPNCALRWYLVSIKFWLQNETLFKNSWAISIHFTDCMTSFTKASEMSQDTAYRGASRTKLYERYYWHGVVYMLLMPCHNHDFHHTPCLAIIITFITTNTKICKCIMACQHVIIWDWYSPWGTYEV